MAITVLAGPGDASASGSKPGPQAAPAGDSDPEAAGAYAVATGAEPMTIGAESMTMSAEPAAGDAEPLPEARTALTRRLDKWLRQLVGPGQAFATLPAEAQHDLRKKAKRLRYGLAFAAPFLDKPAQRRILAALTQVQTTLGELNDLYVAELHYRSVARTRPQAWFAMGWLRAMQQRQKDAAQEAFTALAAAGRLKD